LQKCCKTYKINHCKIFVVKFKIKHIYSILHANITVRSQASRPVWSYGKSTARKRFCQCFNLHSTTSYLQHVFHIFCSNFSEEHFKNILEVVTYKITFYNILHMFCFTRNHGLSQKDRYAVSWYKMSESCTDYAVVCFTCIFECFSIISILMKFYGKVKRDPRTVWLDFGSDISMFLKYRYSRLYCQFFARWQH